jgi:hypothetical protein
LASAFGQQSSYCLIFSMLLLQLLQHKDEAYNFNSSGVKATDLVGKCGYKDLK